MRLLRGIPFGPVKIYAPLGRNCFTTYGAVHLDKNFLGPGFEYFLVSFTNKKTDQLARLIFPDQSTHQSFGPQICEMG